MNLVSLLQHQNKLAQFIPSEFDLLQMQKSHLAGYFYIELNQVWGNMTSQKIETLSSHWKGQLLTSINYQDELSILAEYFIRDNLKPILLKGIVLQNEIYQDPGQRAISDVDILISAQELSIYEKILFSLNYEEENEIKWKANRHKKSFIKTTDYNFVLRIELHTRLYPVTFSHLSYSTTPLAQAPYLKLSNEDHFVFLIFHLAYQHTFIKPHWLLDLHLFLKRYNTSLDWDKVDYLFSLLNIKISRNATLFALNKFSHTPIKNLHLSLIEKTFLPLLLTENFLSNPDKNTMRYYLLKHYLKGSLIQALKYDLGWITNKTYSLALGFLKKSNK